MNENMKDQNRITGSSAGNRMAAGEEEENARLELLLKMAGKRKDISTPDVDAAWEDFRARHVGGMRREPREPRRMRPWVAALWGAAAMWCAVMLYEWMEPLWLNPDSGDPFVALRYEQAPRRVVLDNGGGKVDFSQVDSFSFVSHVARAPRRNAAGAAVPEPVAGSDTLRGGAAGMDLRKLSTPRGMEVKVILPDGSEVRLNAESTIEFPKAFGSVERRVALHGEAFFKVSHDEAHPFVVTADNMEIRVHGTEFNLRNYAEEGTSCVSLVKGSVEVAVCGEEGKSVMIEPGEKAWCEGSEVKVAEEDIYVVTQWVHGLFYFDGEPLLEVLQELGRWYNYGVVFYNKEAMAYAMHFSASREESLEEAVGHLNRLRKFRVEIEGQDIVVY